MRSALAAAAVLVVLTAVASISAAPAPSLPRVTIIADSAFAAVTGNQEPLAVVKSGFNVDIDVGICRRLAGTSCPSDGGVAPPTLVDVVHSLGPVIAPTVVVEVGYNEFVDTFPQSVETAITTLLGAGVTKILWLTMADGRPQYVPMNQVLAAAAGRHPEVELVDWAAASRGHDSWFQGDSVHLTYDGALGMAHLLHDALMKALVPPLVVVPTQLPVAHVGKPYSVQLKARGGILPYRWSLTSGPLPTGLHLLASGRVTGTPHRARKLGLSFRITDAVGQATRLTTKITIAGR
jgi:hypothetical protein